MLCFVVINRILFSPLVCFGSFNNCIFQGASAPCLLYVQAFVKVFSENLQAEYGSQGITVQVRDTSHCSLLHGTQSVRPNRVFFHSSVYLFLRM